MFFWKQLFRSWVLWMCLSPLQTLWGQQVSISEFMAANQSILVDEDDDRSDWIELYNGGLTEINLEGWGLTDDPTHEDAWIFPSITLFPNGYLTVFASGKNRSSAQGPLHTHFRLSQEGDYLALLTPEGEIATAFAPKYAPQSIDVSYGAGVLQADEQTLLPARSRATAWVPDSSQWDSTWMRPSFDDGSWVSGTSAVGYDYAGLIGLDVATMRGNTTSVYARFPFELDTVPNLDRMILRIRYEDGYVAYLNGKQVAADNDPSTLNWQSGSTQNRPDGEAVNPVDVDISSAIDLLIPGENVLAIHGLNQGLTSSDLLILPELIGQTRPEGELGYGYLLTPTPGSPNSNSIDHLTPEVRFSRESGVFTGSLSIELSFESDPNQNLQIHYTLDGSKPNTTSPIYQGPLSLSQTTQLRAITADEEGGISPIASHTYIALSRQTSDFSSNLPVIILENYGAGRPPQNSRQFASMLLYEPQGERMNFNGPPSLAVRSGIKVRGSSTSGRPKPSLSLEAWNEYDQDINIAPLDLPGESDWVLWGPYNFDLTLMHNPFIYELSNQIGRYASRTRFVEVFLNINGGALSDSDYYGVYALTEKISRDEDRVAVDRLFPEHGQEPAVSGGYIFKIDRADPGDSGFNGAGQSIRYVYPKEVAIERPERDPQQQYIQRFFQDFSRALSRTTLADGESGYAGLLDVDAAIDHHLLNVVAFNVDALRLSGYFHKPRGGKLTFGPIWDFDRALGSTDGRDNNPLVWRSASGDRGTDFFNYPWWNNLFRDLDFWQRYIDRYQELRASFFSDSATHAVMDSMAAELAEAQVRNLERWNQRPRGTYGGTYQGEVNHMKEWLSDRLAFMDGQFVDPPTIRWDSLPNGDGRSVFMIQPDGAQIYYTLDGSDPRAMGGDPSEHAKLYTRPLTQAKGETATLVARAFDAGHRSRTGANNPALTSLWSGPRRALLSWGKHPQPGDLLVTEIQFHPGALTEEELAQQIALREEDFEFFEIKNISSEQVELAGLSILGGVRLELEGDPSIIVEPGGYIVVAKNPSALPIRHPTLSVPLLGPYQGNLSNGGESIQFINQEGQLLLDVDYDDDWYTETDGEGRTLVLRNELQIPASNLGADAWRSSTSVEGSPGLEDPQAAEIEMLAIEMQEGGVSITFLQTAGVRYLLETTTDLQQLDWSILQTIPVVDQDKNTSIVDANHMEPQRFYRLRAVAP